MPGALVISGNLVEAEEIHHLLSRGKFNDMTFRYPGKLSKTTPPLATLYTECSDVIREEDIDVIIALRPEYTLILVALLEKYPNLCGPSAESVFLCLHRYYNKEYISHGFNAAFFGAPLCDIETKTVADVLDDINSPVIMRDCYSLDNTLVKKLRSEKQFKNELPLTTKLLKHSVDFLGEFLSRYISLNRYPILREPAFVIEEYLTDFRSTYSVHYVEACIVDGVMSPWVITDVHTFKQKPKFTMSYSCLPSKLQATTQHQVWGTLREVSQKLIDFGFDNHFFHAKLAVSKAGTEIRIIDVKPCVNTCFTPLYRDVFLDGDNIRGQIETSLGQKPWIPKAKPGHYALQAEFMTQLDGVPLKDIVDTKVAKHTANVEVLCHSDAVIQDGCHEYGQPLIRISSYGNSFESCHRDIKSICAKILKQGHKESGLQTSDRQSDDSAEPISQASIKVDLNASSIQFSNATIGLLSEEEESPPSKVTDAHADHTFPETVEIIPEVAPTLPLRESPLGNLIEDQELITNDHKDNALSSEPLPETHDVFRLTAVETPNSSPPSQLADTRKPVSPRVPSNAASRTVNRNYSNYPTNIKDGLQEKDTEVAGFRRHSIGVNNYGK